MFFIVIVKRMNFREYLHHSEDSIFSFSLILHTAFTLYMVWQKLQKPSMKLLLFFWWIKLSNESVSGQSQLLLAAVQVSLAQAFDFTKISNPQVFLVFYAAKIILFTYSKPFLPRIISLSYLSNKSSSDWVLFKQSSVKLVHPVQYMTGRQLLLAENITLAIESRLLFILAKFPVQMPESSEV